MSVISIKEDNGFKPISALQGSPGVAGATGVGITSISAGQSTNNDIYTVTPVTFEKSDGSSDTINVQAYNGYKMSDIVDLIYPIDSIYISLGSTNPSILFGGTWSQINGRFLLASGSGYTLSSYGGEAAHTLTSGEIPAHSHQVLAGAGGNGPYLASPPEYTPSTGNTFYYLKYDGVTNESGGSGTGMVNTNTVGGNSAHNNMPPYLVVNMWRRIG